MFGVHRDGGFRELVPVPARNVVKVRADLPMEIAALAEPFSIAANVLSRTGCGPEDTVLIYGAGTVGLTVLQVAKLKGARCLISDLDEARLERARAFGADVVINPQRTPVADAVRGEHGRPGPVGGHRRGRCARRCSRKPAGSPARPAASASSASRPRLATSASRRSSRRSSRWSARDSTGSLLPEVVDGSRAVA